MCKDDGYVDALQVIALCERGGV